MRSQMVFFACVAVSVTVLPVWAMVTSTRPHHEARSSKSGEYIQEGFFTGGSRSVTSARLKDIRRGKDPHGFERIVLDVEPGTQESKGVPYYQVQLSPSESRLVVSIWADVTYDFDAARVQKSFAKSAHIKRLNVVPRVEEGLAIVELQLKAAGSGKNASVEAFHLENPSRIILDVR